MKIIGIISNNNINLSNIINTINNLPTYSDTNAFAEDLLDGKTAYSKMNKIIGTMNNIGQQIIIPSTTIQNINQGYHDGTGYVEAVSANIDPNITPNNIKMGISILNIEGNLSPDKPDQTKTVDPTLTVQNIVPDVGYELSSVIINAVSANIDPNITPEVIKNGVSILNIIGNLSEGIDTSDANAIADDISFGKTAYVNGVKLTGTMENLEPTILNQANLISNLYDTVNLLQVELNNKSGSVSKFIVPNGMKFSHSAVVYNNGTGWDIGNVIDMQYMFQSCGLLKTLDVSNWDTSNVTDMRFLFSGCYNVLDLDVSNWDTSKVTAMNGMFNYCNLLTQLNVENWNVSNVIHMGSMFGYCQNITTLNLTNWDTSNAQYMGTMFDFCNKLQSIDIGNWNTINVNALNGMFQNCHNLIDVNVYNLNTSNVKNLSKMFYRCNKLVNIDVSNWNTINVTNISNMFYQCNNLVNIDVSNWNVNKVTDMTNIFRQCNNLSDASIDSVINMCLNSSVSASYKNLSPSYSYSPFSGSNITNGRYQSRWSELTAAGWSY